jgi:hypothetical protein
MAHGGNFPKARASILMTRTAGELSNDTLLILDRNSAPLIQPWHRKTLDRFVEFLWPSGPPQRPPGMSSEEEPERQGARAESS